MENRQLITLQFSPQHSSHIEFSVLTDEVERSFQRIVGTYCIRDHYKV